ncbi:MAG TPA: N-6 DNA methylase [Methanotrichaceae archaeon]|nr:N-6 DNA methylase [Methanotrichaceae archaeon]
MAAPQEIADLVERFERNVESYRSGRYNETQLRREFIDPFFKALGWDVDNEKGYAEAYKDVIHEDAIKVGASTKAPDYCFRIGGARKFFVEAKKPSVNLKDDISPAFQLRRYSWSAKHLPLGILTDFEELAVYDGRIKPVKNDKASKARVKYLTYKEYIDRWDEIASIFSREEVLKGSFDKYVESSKKKRGTAEVDAAFLKDIENWRDLLARNIALRNPDLSTRELNFAVQRTIDRIVFLRICEDRGIEKYGWLQSLLEGARVYPRLIEFFHRADERYNSGLFHFGADPEREEPPDELTLSLEIDDKILKEIIRDLYYPDSPYEFSVLPPEILGQVYEQFLGKVISLTAGHRAKVEYKPEVRKAGGVYYTPSYIVNYIVENTVGKLLEGQTPTTASELRILDPACGSGSFLIGAYQKLLDWHRDWYADHLVHLLETGKTIASKEVFALLPGDYNTKAGKGKGKGKKKNQSNENHFPIFQAKGGEWKLTTEERKRILLNNIRGVDIDPAAVEVTKLSLHLKVLEGESEETLSKQLKLFQERALPDLGENIKCGNSLIGWDILEANPGMTEEEIDRINPFDWGREFPDIMRRGGFDAVIGNPPYVRQEGLGNLKEGFKRNYCSYNSTADLYVYFIEKGLTLLGINGVLGIIVSRSFLRSAYAKQLRHHIREKYSIINFVDFEGLPVFTNAKDTYVCIPILSNVHQPDNVYICKINSLDNIDINNYIKTHQYEIPISRFTSNGWSLASESKQKLQEKLFKIGDPLGNYVNKNIYYGIKTGFNKAFEIDEATYTDIVKTSPKCQNLIKLFLGGQDIRRYFIRDSKRYLIVIPSGWTKEQIEQTKENIKLLSEDDAWGWLLEKYKPLAKHLEIFKASLKNRHDQGEFWWELRPCNYYDFLDGQKIIYPDIAKEPRFFFDIKGTYISNTAYCLGSDDLYLLGILNSKLSWFSISRISIPFGTRAGRFRFRLIYQYMEQLPIRAIDFSDPQDVARHDSMVKLVEKMLDLHRRLAETKTGHEKTLLSRQIEATDRQIDDLVYELYGLTEEEIAIVEEASG